MTTADNSILTADSGLSTADGRALYRTDQATAEALIAGFVLAPTRFAASSTVPAGYAIGWVTAAGATVPVGTTLPFGTSIGLVISSGPSAATLTPTMPNVVGLDWRAAEAVIYASPGIGITNPAYTASALPQGQVLAQSVAPGPVAPGTLVQLTLAATVAPPYAALGTIIVPALS